jgi:hypothetical protein
LLCFVRFGCLLGYAYRDKLSVSFVRFSCAASSCERCQEMDMGLG